MPAFTAIWKDVYIHLRWADHARVVPSFGQGKILGERPTSVVIWKHNKKLPFAKQITSCFAKGISIIVRTDVISS